MLNDVLNHEYIFTVDRDNNLLYRFDPCFLDDLVILYVGFRTTFPGDYYGPAARDHFVYHYMYQGNALFETMFESYNVDEGCGFLAFPNEQVKQIANSDPSSYFYFGFKGNKAKEIVNTASMTVRSPVITHMDIKRAVAIMNGFLVLGARDSNMATMEAHALFYEMITFWAHENNRTLDRKKSLRHRTVQETYIDKALTYIEQNYNKNIQVSHVADFLNINPSYFSRIFKNEFHMTASSYLQQFRLEAAKNLLTNSSLTVNQIAIETGFEDSTYFISIFKKKYNVTPKQFRDQSKTI